MANDKPTCKYDYGTGSKKACPHPPMTNPNTGEVMDYCIFHAPMADKTGRDEEFWRAFEEYFNETKCVFSTASDEKKGGGVLDCEGFVIPDTGERFQGRVFPFSVFFKKVKFDFWANFKKAEFKGDALFLEAKFVGWVDFRQVKFEGRADFKKAMFEGAALFGEAKFEKWALFIGAKFGGWGNFWRTKFEGVAVFIEARFEDISDFEEAEFVAGGHFPGARLCGTNFTEVDIRGIDFSRAVLGEFAQRAEYRGGVITRLYPLGSADFTGAQYNAHNVYLQHPFSRDFLRGLIYRAIPFVYEYCLAWIRRKVLKRNIRLPEFHPPSKLARFRRTRFTGVDTSAVDWSKNPRLGRDIRYQQFLKQFWDRGPGYKFLYFIWWLTSRCGESFKRWLGWSTVIVLSFAFVYANVSAENGKPLVAECPISGVSNPADLGYPPFITALYFSVVTFTTLGFGDVIPVSDWGKVAVGIEVILGYFMLGGLIALFANKLVRRE